MEYDNQKNLPWILKYQPRRAEEFMLHKSIIEKTSSFVENFKKQKKKAILLYGPTGIGKTSLVHAISKSFDYETLEMNSSDYRNKKEIDSVIGIASNQMSLFSKGKIILLDEVDAMSGRKDRGGASEIAKIVKESSFPVIMTAIDPWDSKLSALRKVSELIEIKEPTQEGFVRVLQHICEKENIYPETGVLNSIVSRSGTDVRGAINDLQQIAYGDKIKKEELITISDRNKKETMPKVLLKILKSKDEEVLRSAFNDVDVDLDEAALWMDENVPKEYTDPDDLSNAYNYISKANIFSGRIRRRQYWRFLVYINSFLSLGVGLSKKNKYQKFVQYKPTSRILKMWISKRKYAKRDTIAKKISEHTHISLKDSIKQFELIKQFAGSKKYKKEIAEDLDLDKDEIVYLSR
ncbi:MAG: replication factor C large subunit [Candidatus Woesearchaeota archaeon]